MQHQSTKNSQGVINSGHENVAILGNYLCSRVVFLKSPKQTYWWMYGWNSIDFMVDWKKTESNWVGGKNATELS